MKKTTFYIFSITLLLISAIGHSDINLEYRLDTSKSVNSKMVIFVSPTLEEIKKMKTETKDLDDFYTAADDINYYNGKAMEFLEKYKFPYKLTEKKKIKFTVDNKVLEMDYSKSDAAWFILIYNGKDKPTKAYAVDIDEHETLLKQLTEPTSTPAPSPQ